MRPSRLLFTALFILAAFTLLPTVLQAQPFVAWAVFSGDGLAQGNASNGRLEIPSTPDLNPASELTIEAWVNLQSPHTNQNCRSIVGKGFVTTYWVGICGTKLRAYLKGSGSLHDAGIIPNGQWTHVAITFDGTTQRHYINGELVGSFAVTGPLPFNSQALRIGSDVNWNYSPNGDLNEVRLWNVARTTEQIRSTINVPITAATPGLVDVWPMTGPSGNSILGTHNGTFSGNVFFFTFPATLSCGSSTVNSLCLFDHFSVSARYRVGPPGGAEGTAHVVVAGPGSGIFQFFSSDNWEILVKMVNGCGLNSRFWVFSAATTNVFYRMEVVDVHGSGNKIYFNYPGPPAPAVTDTSAFASCP